VVIAGRPNVGKSTLFNRLAGRRLALVDDQPGVTRDVREADGRIGNLKFRLLDTAGLEDAEEGSLAARMTAMTERAVDQADIVLFMVDARTGITPEDEHFARWLRRKGKPVILLANKAERSEDRQAALEAYALGLGDPVPVSAAHGHGLDELHDRLEEEFEFLDLSPPRDGTPETEGPSRQETEEETDRRAAERVEEERAAAGEISPTDETDEAVAARPLRLAIVGRPNAGKSTLVNRLLGQERVLTGPEAGITRDAIGVDWQWHGRRIRLWDTAGMRRRARIKERLEKLSVADALRAIRFADVVVLLLDATEPLRKQDLAIADLVAREGRALVIAVNKWDLVKDRERYRKELERAVDRLLPQVIGAPVVTLSARTGENVNRLMPAVMGIYEVWNRRIPTARLNRWLQEATSRHPPPAPGGRRIKLRYVTQPKTRPPTFVAFTQQADKLPEEYVRYLVKSLRDSFDMWGTPIRFRVREVENPYDEDGGRRETSGRGRRGRSR
jgi:GTP-binding protein